jgi:hypothetical protein
MKFGWQTEKQAMGRIVLIKTAIVYYKIWAFKVGTVFESVYSISIEI